MEEETPEVPQAAEVALAVDPAEAVATTSLPRGRGYAIKRPGHIALAVENGNYPGCRLMTVTTRDGAIRASGITKGQAEEVCATLPIFPTPTDFVNEFFRMHGGLLVVSLKVSSNGDVAVLYTNQLEGDELEEFQAFSQLISTHMDEWRAKRDAAREEARAQAQQKEQDTEELVEIGKKAREHNLFGKLRDLEKQVAELKAELKTAKRRAAR